MGKITLYHPVSLHVLRGALMYGGFTVGKFIQHNSNRDLQYATYEVEIKTWPDKIAQVSPELLKVHLNNCFASDVNFLQVWVTRSGKRMARLETHIEPYLQPIPQPRRYEDLSPEEQAEIPF